jgi:hypothetical protein
MSNSAPPAGWYADPSGQYALRWWDGNTWTDHTQDQPGSASDQGQNGQQVQAQQQGHQQYGSQQYGSQQYGSGWPSSAEQQYAAPYGAYGYGAAPGKPAPVVVAAVLAFLFGAVGVLVTVLLLIGGAALGSLAQQIDQADVPAGAITGVFVAIGLVSLVWTVLVIWGGVWALTGRSRVLLIVGGSITTAFTALMAVAGIAGSVTDGSDTGGNAGSLVFVLLVLAAAIATVVLPCLSSSKQFYAAHRARRGR